jgi:hypothetical protein
MSTQEEQLLVIPDVVLPADINTRYDIYFTDRRIAIVCMGLVDRYGYSMGKMHAFPAASSAVTPPMTYVDEKDTAEAEEQLSTVPLNDLLKLSKKSCQYALDEIEAVKLIWGKQPKFMVQSQDCESRFTPDEVQFKELLDILTSFEPLSDKLKVAGSWKQLQALLTTVVCGSCGGENDLDAVCCVNCGQEIWEQTEEEEATVACCSCGKKNRKESAFCKQCGKPFHSTESDSEGD